MKIKYYLFGLLTSLSFITTINAATLELKTDDKLVINEKGSITVNVNLKLEEEEELENISFDLDYNNELLNIKVLEDENGEDVSYGYAQIFKAGTAQLFNASKSFVNGPIISFTLKNISTEDSTAKLSLKNVKLKLTNEEKTKELEEEAIQPLNLTLKKEVTTTTKAKNTSAELKGFTANNGATIKPAFSKDVKEYKIYVKDTLKQITITTNTEQTGVKAEIECTLGCTSSTNEIVADSYKHIIKLNIDKGKNEATFKFTSEDEKNNEEYKFIIYRGATTDGSNLLSDLSFEEDIKLNEKFDKSNLDYTAKVPYEIEKLKVIATPEDSNADVSIKGNDSLSVGENVITVTVTSTETMEKKIYNITVTREEFVPKEENTTKVTPVIEKEKPQNNNNIKLIIIIGAVSTFIIGIAAYFIFFFKGKKKNKVRSTSEEKISTEKIQNSIIDEDTEPTSVDDALKDLMQTRELTNVDKIEPRDE